MIEGERFMRYGDRDNIYELKHFRLHDELSLAELGRLEGSKDEGIFVVGMKMLLKTSSAYREMHLNTFDTDDTVNDHDAWAYREVPELLDTRDQEATFPISEVNPDIVGVFHWASLKSRKSRRYHLGVSLRATCGWKRYVVVLPPARDAKTIPTSKAQSLDFCCTFEN